MGQQDAAVASLRHLAELIPAAALGQYRLGQTFAFLNRPDDAMAAYRKAIENDPGFLPAWQALVNTEATSINLDQSLRTVAEAGQQSAIASYTDVLKGEAYLAVKRYPEAENAFKAELAHAPDVRWMVALAKVRALAGNQAASIGALAEWLKAHPEDDGVRVLYAAALMDSKDNVAAIREYQTLLKSDPINVTALSALAKLYGVSEPKKALAYANFAFGLTPLSPEVRDTLAWTLLENGNVAAATILSRMAYAQRPEDPDIGYHLAASLARGGDPAGARALVKPLAQSTVAFSSQDDAKLLLHKLEKAE
jgi:tetratricopeptide (TPR) repeat protein